MDDENHVSGNSPLIFLSVHGIMIFSKSFGYALRGILYIAMMKDEKRFVQSEEVAERLAVPKHFMSKILKMLVQQQLLVSNKGPAGGFALHEGALDVRLIELVNMTDGLVTFSSCVLRVKECNAQNPCPLHEQMVDVKNRLLEIVTTERIGDLLHEDKTNFINSISTTPVVEPKAGARKG
jgi:Rrf2 family transcriptional regulator, iron-sulfur cluster assembly transcription factor